MDAPSNLTRASLLSRARSQDSQAWTQLVELYGPLVGHWARRCGLSSQQSADIVQEVFASVSKSIASFRVRQSNGAFRAWLWTITSNKIKDVYRTSARHISGAGGSSMQARLEQVPELLPDEDPSDAAEISDLVRRGLEQVRAEFEPRTWDIFRRSVIDQIPSGTVAEEFCVTAAAVRQVRSRVLRRLRMQLGDLEE